MSGNNIDELRIEYLKKNDIKYCPDCGCLNVMFDSQPRFYKCHGCGSTWAFDKDDPDKEDTGSDNFIREIMYSEGEYDPITDTCY